MKRADPAVRRWLYAAAASLAVLLAPALAAGATAAGATAAGATVAGATVAGATASELAQARSTPPVQGSLYVEAAAWRLAESLGLPVAAGSWLLVALGVLVACALVVTFILLYALIAVWLERKVSAHMQCRLGPMEVGYHGLLQTLTDSVKLLVKEDIIPRLADRPIYILGPVIVFTGVLVRFVPLPFGEKLVASDLDLGLFFVAAVGSVEVVGVIMSGWSSNNKWSLFGTMRSATQMVSYEIPIGLTFLAVIAAAGTFSLQAIIGEQQGWLWNWNIFRNPFLFVLAFVYFMASLAECKRAPFDLPEAESELVSGFHTEYSGMRFAMFFLAEYAAMYLVSAVAATIFLGGWWTGIPLIDEIGAGPDASTFAVVAGFLIKAAAIISKAMLLIFVQMWLRWTLPRMRLDQMMHVCWKVLLPASLVGLVGSVLWELAVGGRPFFGIPALFGT